jgi:CRP-like cAMP-binding protein
MNPPWQNREIRMFQGGAAQSASPDMPTRNRLLAALKPEDYNRLVPYLEPVTFELKKLLYEPNADITHVYFPTSGMVSMVNEMRDGTVEVGTVGNEGMVGTPILLRSRSSPSKTFIQLAGDGYRLHADIFLAWTREAPEAERLLYQYVQVIFNQSSQWIACNRLHALEARCARWLLWTQDRAGSDQFLLTQEFLSYMLGTHRPAVSIAAGTLSHAGLIKYRRGNVTVVDRAGLEAAACECYMITRSAIDRLLEEAGA